MREVALDAFVEVMDHRRKPEAAVAYLYEKHAKNIKRIDKNFVKELLYGSLRWHAKMFWILQNTANRDLARVTPQVRSALILGTYQIYYMDRVPDRAAVNESVEYIRKKGQANACSFVNGILRQIARRAEYFAKPDKVREPAAYLSLQYAHPRWMIERWLTQFSYERTEEIASANNRVPPVFVRVNTRRGLPAHRLQSRLLREERLHAERRPLRCSLKLRSFPQLADGSLFAAGFYTVQDEAAQLVSFLVNPRAGETVFDLCSGVGGKLSHLCELSDGAACITAIDKSAVRLQQAEEALRRLGHEGVVFLCEDISKWSSKTRAHKILLDAPCSGLGVLRRHPEGKWHKEEALIKRLAQLQRELIVRAFAWLRKGGELVYSVCSFEAEESNAVLDYVRAELGERMTLVSPVSRLPDYYKRYVTRRNILQIYPGNHDAMDGFSAFIIRAEA